MPTNSSFMATDWTVVSPTTSRPSRASIYTVAEERLRYEPSGAQWASQEEILSHLADIRTLVRRERSVRLRNPRDTYVHSRELWATRLYGQSCALEEEFFTRVGERGDLLQLKPEVITSKFPSHYHDAVTEGFLAGGAITSLLLDRTPQDWDIFFPNESAMLRTLERLLLKSVGNLVSQHSDRSHTLCLGDCKIQLIRCRYGSMQQVLDGFDLSVCQVAYYFDQGLFCHGDTYLDDIRNNRVRIGNLHNPVSTFNRLAKYVGRGFKCSQEDLDSLKMSLLNHTTSQLSEFASVCPQDEY